MTTRHRLPFVTPLLLRRVAAAALLIALVCSGGVSPAARGAVALVEVARGVSLATITDATLLDPQAPGALSIKALKLDTRFVRLRSVVADDRLPALERVLEMSRRTGAIAAINAGFFTSTGGPAGLLVVSGVPVGFGVHPRGAVAIRDDGTRAHLSFGRARLGAVPDPLATSRMRLAFWHPEGRDLSAWQRADDVVGGAGLLVEAGLPVIDFAVERMRDDFPVLRHPRTLIGVDRDEAVWLVAVDGRRPDHSVGMSFVELQRLCAYLGLRDALNLDGGGSTTLVVRGEVVNRPTDLTGPRAVSDAIVVMPR